MLVVVLMAFSVWFLANSGGNQNSKLSIDTSGGSINYLDKVILSVEAGTFDAETEITITDYNGSTQGSEVVLVSAYEFGPSGIVFDPPANLIIHYDPKDMPDNISESELGVYLLEGTKWVMLNGSSVNTAQNTVSASVSHFTKMGCGASSGGSVSPDDLLDGGEELEDGYATAWFKANILFRNVTTRTDSDSTKYSQYDYSTYIFGAHVSWEPATYVKYYQVKFDFNNNPPENYAWSYDYTEQGKYTHMPFSYKEGLVYHLGTDYDKPNYIGRFQLSEQLGGKHGFVLLGFEEEIYDSEVNAGLNVDLLLSEIQQFTYAYYDGWEIWVRAVIERPA